MGNRIVVGVDPSTHTGLCACDLTGKVVEALEVSSDAVGFQRVSEISGQVLAFIAKHSPEKIIIEAPIIGHASSARTLLEVAYILRYFLWQEGYEYLEVPPATLKVFVCGLGNAKKEQMLMGVFKHYGYESATNNIADAVGLAEMGVSLVTGNCLPHQFEPVRKAFLAKPAGRKKVKK